MAVLLYLLLGIYPALAADLSWVILPRAAPIYKQPAEGAALLVMAEAGEKIALRKKGQVYSRVQVKRAGKWRVGYLLNSDLEAIAISTPRGQFAFGAGGFFSYLRHGGKDFSTEDQVKYSTEPFTSSTFSPFLAVQFEPRDFWRFFLAYRMTDYSSSATTDVPGAVARKLELRHTMISFVLQKMWTPFKKPNFYFGLGLEASRAISADLVMGSNKLPVASEDLPTYLGGHGAAGYQLDFGRSLSAFAEFRGTGFFNQSPMILGAEVAAGLLYWP